VFAAFLILIFLICASAITLFMDSNIFYGLEAAMMAIATSLVAVRCTPANLQSLHKLSRPAFLFGAVPALWMIIQVLPLGYIGVANPVWESAQSTLGHTIAGSIGIDTGSGLLALCWYISTTAVLFVTMAVALDRSRADGVLFALLATAIFICLPTAGLPSWLYHGPDQPADIGALRNVAALGVLLAVAAAIRALERRQSSRGYSRTRFLLALVASVVSLMVCGSVITQHWTYNLAFGLGLALTTFLAVTAILYFRIGSWGASAIAMSVLTTSVVFIWIQFGSRDPMVAFSDDGSLVDLTKRILSDANWIGSGAGSFEALSNIYRASGDALNPAIASTAAARIAIELGRPMFWAIAIMILLAVTSLLRGALRRRRDAYYPALGACCLVAILISAFGNTGILTPAASTIAICTIGLALAQSISRTTR
jgi:hypothetical protein